MTKFNLKNCLRCAHILAILGLFFLFSYTGYGQAIYYASDKTTMDITTRFHVIGDNKGLTVCYVQDKKNQEHMLHFYDLEMHLVKKKVLSSIPYQDRVLGVHFIGNGSKYAVVHVRQTDGSSRSCYITEGNFENLAQVKSKKVMSVIHSEQDRSQYFHLTEGDEGNYFFISMFGGYNEKEAIFKMLLYDTRKEKIVKKTRQIIAYNQNQVVQESISGMYLNKDGDAFFYMTSKDEYGGIKYAKVFIQPQPAHTWAFHYVGVPQHMRVYQISGFYNSISKSWNLYSTYHTRPDITHVDGFLLRSWSAKTSKMSENMQMSFKDALVNIKDQIDPYVIEDIPRYTKNDISHDEIRDVLSPKKKDKENQEEFDEYQKEYLDEESDVSLERLDHLAKIMSVRRVDVIDVVPMTRNQLLVMLEEKGFKNDKEDSEKGFFSKVAQNVSVGVNVGLGSGVGAYTPLTHRAGMTSDNQREEKVQKLGNLLIFNMNTEGNLFWASTISKRQISQLGENLSFSLLQQTNKLLLFYINTYAPSFLYALQVFPKGGIEVGKTIRGVSSAYKLITSQARQVNQHSLIIPCIHQNNIVFSRVVYDD